MRIGESAFRLLTRSGGSLDAIEDDRIAHGAETHARIFARQKGRTLHALEDTSLVHEDAGVQLASVQAADWKYPELMSSSLRTLLGPTPAAAAPPLHVALSKSAAISAKIFERLPKIDPSQQAAAVDPARSRAAREGAEQRHSLDRDRSRLMFRRLRPNENRNGTEFPGVGSLSLQAGQ